MPPSHDSLLELTEEMYGTRDPDFDSIRREYEQLLEKSQDESAVRDARLLLAGLDTVRNTYEDWGELTDYEKENALKAIERIRGLTASVSGKYDIDVD